MRIVLPDGAVADTNAGGAAIAAKGANTSTAIACKEKSFPTVQMISGISKGNGKIAP